MLDAVDSGPRRRLDPARAMRMRHHLQPERMRGIGDAGHFGIGEMRLEPAALLAQHPAGGGDLDHVRTVLARAADLLGAFHRAGAGVTRGEHFVDLGAEARDVAVPADDGQRRACSDDPRPLDHAFLGPAPQREAAVLRAPRLAHGGEARAQRLRGVLRANDHAPFLGLDRVLPEIAAGVAGQMDVQVDQTRHHGHALEPHRFGTRRGRVPAALDADDAAIGDRDRRRASRLAVGIGDDIAGMDHCRVGQSGGGGQGNGQCGGQRQRIGTTHDHSPVWAD